jgi:fructose/tagatose bisphosphate aldolase
MDHAQSEEEIISAAEYPFDSIMVDMSHYEKADNLEKTARLTKMLHAKGIATEAEPGRINGGEDGVKDTGDLEGVLTDEEQANTFLDTGIDFLAPAFGNIHGSYGGVENIKLDFERYVFRFPLTFATSRKDCRDSRILILLQTRYATESLQRQSLTCSSWYQHISR